MDASQLDTETVIKRDPLPVPARDVAQYARISSADHTSDLERRLERLKDDAAAHSYPVTRIVQEIGAGLGDSPPHS